MSRERKPNSIYASEAYIGDEFDVQKAIRTYQKGFKHDIKQKKLETKREKQTIIDKEKNNNIDKSNKSNKNTKQTTKLLKKNNSVPKLQVTKPVIVVLTSQQKLQDEIEEKHIAKDKEEKILEKRINKQKKILPEGPTEVNDINTAIKRGVRENSSLLLDWKDPKVKMIGYLCKVYWDGEDAWFYSRILNYDSYHCKHYVSKILY